MQKILFLIICFILSVSSYAKDYYNPNYKINKGEQSLLLLPIYNDGSPVMNDTLFTKIFNEAASTVSLLNVTETREKIDSDNMLIEILTKISETEYKTKELKMFPDIKTIVTQTEIEYLKKELDNPDLIFIPTIFSVKSVGPYTFGKSRFRLYDLNSGELIFDCSKDLNVNLSGIDGKGSVTAGLLSLTFEYFEKKFLSNLKTQ